DAPGTYTQAFQQALNLLSVVEATLLDADPNHGTILARTDPTVRSFGSTIHLKLETLDLKTYVTVEARSTLTPYDWGVSKRLIKEFEEAWKVQCIPQL